MELKETLGSTCEWRDSPVFPDRYKVSSNGDVYSVVGQKLLKPTVSRTGYLRVNLCDGKGSVKKCTIHRLIAIAFIPNSDGKPTVNHINEDKTDNRVSNLEWATHHEQNVHGTRIARAVAHTDWQNRGIDYSVCASKHDYSQTNMCGRKGVAVYKGGELICKFKSQREAAMYLHCSQSHLSQCLSGEKKLSGGFVAKRTSFLKEVTMFFILEKQIDGEWYEWGRYGVSEIHALVEAAWQFGKMGVPVRVTVGREESGDA